MTHVISESASPIAHHARCSCGWSFSTPRRKDQGGDQATPRISAHAMIAEPCKLTYGEWAHLAGIKSYSADGARYSEMTSPYRRAVMGSLGRKGLVASIQQSEHVRGERRTYWRIYKITPAGLARLAMGSRNVTGVPK